MKNKILLISYVVIILVIISLSLYFSGLAINIDWNLVGAILFKVVIVLLSLPNMFTLLSIFVTIKTFIGKKPICRNNIIFTCMSLGLVALSSFSIFWLINNFNRIDEFYSTDPNSYLFFLTSFGWFGFGCLLLMFWLLDQDTNGNHR